MRRCIALALMGLVLMGSGMAGCGMITAQSLVMKGATWAAGEVAKKEFKHLTKHKRAASSHPAPAREEQK